MDFERNFIELQYIKISKLRFLACVAAWLAGGAGLGGLEPVTEAVVWVPLINRQATKRAVG